MQPFGHVQIATVRNATQPMQKRSLWPACSQVTFLNQFVAIVFNGHAAILPLSLGRWEVCGTRQYGTNLHSISHNQTGTPIFMVFPTCKYPAIWGSILGPRWASIIDRHPYPCFKQTSLPALPVGLWCLTSRRNGTKNQPLPTQHICGKIPSPIWKTLRIVQFRDIYGASPFLWFLYWNDCWNLIRLLKSSCFENQRSMDIGLI